VCLSVRVRVRVRVWHLQAQGLGQTKKAMVKAMVKAMAMLSNLGDDGGGCVDGTCLALDDGVGPVDRTGKYAGRQRVSAYHR
jgi:hypothetical protein